MAEFFRLNKSSWRGVSVVSTLFFLLFLLTAISVPVEAAGLSLNLRLGFSPRAGGSMSSGWQSENLGVRDGLNDINRSSDTLSVTSVEPPVGVVAAFETMFAGDVFYFKTGIWGLYTVSGGEGSTVNQSGTEVVNASYSQWSFDVPVTFGVSLLFWGESRIYLGCGAAFAYGMSSMKFSSSTLNHSSSFAGYAFPLVAELGCEYMTGEMTSVGCGIRYMYGKSDEITSGSDYSRVDFTGFIFTLSASVHFIPRM